MPAFSGNALIHVKLIAEDAEEAEEKLRNGASEWEDWDVIESRLSASAAHDLTIKLTPHSGGEYAGEVFIEGDEDPFLSYPEGTLAAILTSIVSDLGEPGK